MKISPQQLPQHLAKTLGNLYVVSGDEALLVQETLALLRDAANKKGFSERVVINTEGTDWGKHFYASTQTFSLFATKRLLELDLTTIKLNAASSKILQEFTQHLSADDILLIRANKLDSKTEQTSWYKALDKVGVIIPIWPIAGDQLPQWILQRAKKLDLTLTLPAAELLASRVEGNLLAASQELEKLCLLQLSGTIDPQTIEETVTDNTHFDIFALVDSALAGNANRSLKITKNLAAEDIEPTLVLWALTRELRTMAELIKQTQQGVTLNSLFPKFRIFDKRQPNVRAFLQRHKQENCWKLLSEAAQIDRLIKGADRGNVWDSLEKLVLSISLASRVC